MKSVIIAIAVLAVANAGSVDIKINHNNKITITPKKQLVSPLSKAERVSGVDPPPPWPPLPTFCKIPVNGPGTASECQRYMVNGTSYEGCIQDPRCISSNINGLKICDSQCCVKEEDVPCFCGAWTDLNDQVCHGAVCGNYHGNSLRGDAVGVYGKYKTSYCLLRGNINGPSSATGAYGYKICSSNAEAPAPEDAWQQLVTPLSSVAPKQVEGM